MKLWNKFVVLRRDGTVPDWPYLVMGGRDPYAPTGIRAYATAALAAGEDPEYVEDLFRLASSFEEYREAHGPGDPAAGPHRPDSPGIIALFKAGSTPDGWKQKES